MNADQNNMRKVMMIQKESNGYCDKMMMKMVRDEDNDDNDNDENKADYKRDQKSNDGERND